MKPIKKLDTVVQISHIFSVVMKLELSMKYMNEGMMNVMR